MITHQPFWGAEAGMFQEKQLNNLTDYGLASCVATSSGGRLNKKDGLTRYGKSHVKDKTS